MTVTAMRLWRLCFPRATVVLGLRYGLEVRGIHAVALATQVVNHITIRDRPAVVFVEDPVREATMPVNVELPVPKALGQLPHPAWTGVASVLNEVTNALALKRHFAAPRMASANSLV